MEWAQLPPTARARAFALLGDVGTDAAGGVIDASGMRRVALLMRLVPSWRGGGGLPIAEDADAADAVAADRVAANSCVLVEGEALPASRLELERAARSHADDVEVVASAHPR